MPQKGQVTKHEWVETARYDRYTLHKCPHCKVLRERLKGSPTQYFLPVNFSHQVPERVLSEPKCITRKTQTDDNSKGAN